MAIGRAGGDWRGPALAHYFAEKNPTNAPLRAVPARSVKRLLSWSCYANGNVLWNSLVPRALN